MIYLWAKTSIVVDAVIIRIIYFIYQYCRIVSEQREESLMPIISFFVNYDNALVAFTTQYFLG